MKIYVTVLLSLSYIWEKSCSWEIWTKMLSASQIAGFLNQLFLQNKLIKEQIASFFACWYKVTRIKSWSKIFWLGMVKSECDQSSLLTLKMTVSEELTDRMNWFFACWFKLMQIKRWLKFLGVGMIKNGCGQSGDRTLKSTASEERTDGITDSLDFDTDSQKLKADKFFFGWAWSKNGCDQSGHGL